MPDEEQKEKKKRNYLIPKNADILAIATILMTLVFGIWGLYLSNKTLDTSVDIQHFNSLLTKSDMILTKDSILISIQKHLYNLNAEITNQNKIEQLNKIFNRYNELTISFTELEQYLYIFKLKKQGKINIKIQSINEQIKRIDALLGIMKGMPDIDDLVPGYNFSGLYGDALTKLLWYKMLYTDNSSIGGVMDTSYLGQKAFDTLMYNVINLQDLVMLHISEGRNRTLSNLKQMDRITRINNKVMDSLQAAEHF